MSDTTIILPALDIQKLQAAANEAAMKGAKESIDKFYNGYESPFKKQITEHLEKQQINWAFDLPDILGAINEKIQNEIDTIANTSVSKTFVPLVAKFLAREKKEIKFSEILQEFVTAMKDASRDDIEFDDFEVQIKKEEKYDWINVEIRYQSNKEYSFTLHSHKEKDAPERRKLLSLPYDSYNPKHRQTMKLSVDNVTLELPFVKDVLSDNFLSYMARIIIAGSEIEMDCTDFDESMFPDDHCHC